MSWTPLADLHLGTSAILTLLHYAQCSVVSLSALTPIAGKSAQFHFQKPYQGPLNPCARHFYNASYVPGCTKDYMR